MISSDNIRILVGAMVERARSGHPGGAMGGADFMDVLYGDGEFLRYDPGDGGWFMRDRFFMDPGHESPLLYATLSLAGFYSGDDLKNFRQWGSVTPGHPEWDARRGVENTSGPLGQGHAMALGSAIAERFLVARFGEWMSHRTYVYISDGGIQEEVSQGVGRIAGHLGLANMVMFYDANNVQLSTRVDEVDTEDVAKKYEAWGWRVETIDGNDAEEIRGALRRANGEKERPTLIIGQTVMAKGAVGAEGKVSTHGQPLSAAGCDFDATVRALGGDPAQPFAVFPETAKRYGEARERLIADAKKRREQEKRWRAENGALAYKLDLFLSGRLPELDFSQVDIKADSATRAASSAVLGFLAERVGNMIVASADLSNSDKTDGFLKKTRVLTKGDFGGQFFQPGVAELTMACVMNGMALHGGVIPACGTFFVFSDYMKPAVRLSALQRLPVKYVWSHDSFRVGEDGPTHQPVEHEMQIRLMEHLHNHRGERSMVVLRPADAAETVRAWEIALREERPVALVLSRQDVRSLPVASPAVEKGAYIVVDAENPDVVMVGSGSDVGTLVEGARLLEGDGIRARVVSVPSEGIFRDQSAEYRERILPRDVPRYGLTSGLPVTLQGLVGENGVIHGLDHFGYSAPFKVLEQEFGFTAEAVRQGVVKMLGA